MTYVATAKVDGKRVSVIRHGYYGQITVIFGPEPVRAVLGAVIWLALLLDATIISAKEPQSLLAWMAVALWLVGLLAYVLRASWASYVPPRNGEARPKSVAALTFTAISGPLRTLAIESLARMTRELLAGVTGDGEEWKRTAMRMQDENQRLAHAATGGSVERIAAFLDGLKELGA